MISFFFGIINQLINQLHLIHLLFDFHLKRKSTISIENFKKVFAKIPDIPKVDSCTLFMLNRAKMEVISVAIFLKESTGDSFMAIWRSLNEDLFSSCLDIAEIDELSLCQLNHEAALCSRDNVS